MTWNGPLNKIDEYRYEIPSDYKGERHNLNMHTSAVLYVDEEMIQTVRKFYYASRHRWEITCHA